MSHTPGPWETELDTTGANHRTNIRATKDNGFVQICEVNRFVDVKLDGANADLIATAPDLLAMLERVLKKLLEYHPTEHYFLIQEIEQVLRKARGVPR